MVVIWRGLGFLTIPLVGGLMFAGLFAALWITETLQLPNWTKTLDFAVVFLVTGAVNWKLGRYLNRAAMPGRRHDLFFIKMEYWSVPLFLAAALFVASAFYA